MTKKLEPGARRIARLAAQGRWRSRNREANRGAQLRFNYGLPCGEYQKRLASQEGGCAICHKVPLTTRRLAVDHNHRTGDVRGLLCTPCNVALAVVEDSVFIARAHHYLKQYMLIRFRHTATNS